MNEKTTLTKEDLQLVKATYKELNGKGMTIEQKFEQSCQQLPEVHDIQSVRNKVTGMRVLYANTGDTYDTTILCYISHGYNGYEAQFRLGSWGDLVESGRYD